MMAFASQWMTQVTSRVAVGHGGWCARRAGVRYASRLKGLDGLVQEKPKVTQLQDMGVSEILKETRVGAPKGGKAPQPPRQKKKLDWLDGVVQEEPNLLLTQLENMNVSKIPKETKAGAPKGGKAPQPPRQKKRLDGLDGLVQEEPKSLLTQSQNMSMSEIPKETKAGALEGGKARQPPRQEKRLDGLVQALVQEEPKLTQLQNVRMSEILKETTAAAPKGGKVPRVSRPKKSLDGLDRPVQGLTQLENVSMSEILKQTRVGAPKGGVAPQPPRQGKRLKKSLRMSAECQTEPKGGSEEVPLTLGKPEAELEELWKSGKYGTCHSCGGPVKIPGLSHQYCPSCGWVMRPTEDWVINTKEDAKSQHVELEETDFK